MGLRCLFGHDWHGCRCIRCGKTRDAEHDWYGCSCRRCGASRDVEHTWAGCKCTSCGKTRDAEHDWNGCTCGRCGKNRGEQHDWHYVNSWFNDPDPAACGGSTTVYECSICGESREYVS